MKTATEQSNPTMTPTMTPVVDAPTEATEDKDIALRDAVATVSAPVTTVKLSMVRSERSRVERNALRWAMLASGASAQLLRAPSTKDIG